MSNDAGKAEREKQSAALVADIKRASVIRPADAEALATKHGKSVRVVIARAAAAGKYRKDGDNTPTAAAEPQYGVLQPAANLGAGCLTTWLWLVVIVLVIAGVVAVWKTFGGGD